MALEIEPQEQEGWTLSINREKEVFNTSHTSISALMAQEWSLPESTFLMPFTIYIMQMASLKVTTWTKLHYSLLQY